MHSCGLHANIKKQRFAFPATWNICINLDFQDSRQLKKTLFQLFSPPEQYGL